MDRHSRIDDFSVAAHRLAVARLREQPARLNEAREVLRRWRRQAGGPSHCEPYWDEWDTLLQQGVEAVEETVCATTDHAATLRSVSPLGRFVTVPERNQLLRQAHLVA